MKKVLLSICIFLSLNSNASDSTIWNNIGGEYKCGEETFFVDAAKHTFFLKRSLSKFQDVVAPLCYATIAKGHFKILANSAIMLLNDKDFLKAHFDVKQESMFSEDTIYIKINLPQDDAFFSGKFRYLFNFGCTVAQIKVDTIFFKMPKNKIPKCQSSFLSLLIQDLSPKTCREEEKCYQRMFFRIFESLGLSNTANYFTISLWNFNECFVERMDVNNDYVYFDGRNIHWRGNEYKLVKENRKSPPPVKY
jgi:hypothetical protein